MRDKASPGSTLHSDDNDYSTANSPPTPRQESNTSDNKTFQHTKLLLHLQQAPLITASTANYYLKG